MRMSIQVRKAQEHGPAGLRDQVVGAMLQNTLEHTLLASLDNRQHQAVGHQRSRTDQQLHASWLFFKTSQGQRGLTGAVLGVEVRVGFQQTTESL